MAPRKKTNMLTIRHKESGHSETLSEERYTALSDSIKSKYEITENQRVVEPDEYGKSLDDPSEMG